MNKIYFFIIFSFSTNLLAAEEFKLSYLNRAGFGKEFKMIIDEKQILISGVALKFSEMIYNETHIRFIKEFVIDSKLPTRNCAQGEFTFYSKGRLRKGCMEDGDFIKLKKSFSELYRKRLPMKAHS